MKYICVEGCIGVGKTTVAIQLANVINGAYVLLEDFSSHPFLNDFYNDAKYTFETEISFLLIHYHQLLKVMHEQPQLFVSDYSFDKDKLFADANILSEKEMEIFMQLYNYLRDRLERPTVFICLTGTTDLIYNRILTRNREAEKRITYDYIDKINSHYKDFFSEIRKKYNTIDVDMNVNDFVKNPTLINVLRQQLLEQKII
jgi:deoxyadenosine/deoxycytidine kinase